MYGIEFEILFSMISKEGIISKSQYTTLLHYDEQIYLVKTECSFIQNECVFTKYKVFQFEH